MDGIGLQPDLIEHDAGAPPPVISKSAFADELGLSKPRVTQLIEKGLPVRADGKLDRSAALAWYAANVDGSRRKALRPFQPTPGRNWREELDRLKAETAALELAKARGELIDRAAAEKAIFERARLERDAHVAFASRAAPRLAAETAAVFASLDRLLREHLARLAETPLDALRDV